MRGYGALTSRYAAVDFDSDFNLGADLALGAGRGLALGLELDCGLDRPGRGVVGMGGDLGGGVRGMMVECKSE